ncbi:mycothiol synthase [Actinomycetospora endophytica]|uniref:Mycothiol acetyltransferase n=1 Tax=Actinomycetospora endophytica TaxID=2291215 RepID=A0ABS8P3Q9_9PSEU|nr:mycothiol synthase [Actinomycetospora endophytica]MCD2192873.1 mycothiol synthase [Actinomycetospora endophytica]
MTSPVPQWVEPTADERAEIERLVDAVKHADGVSAWSESALLDLATPTGHGRHLVVRDDGGGLVAWAHVDAGEPDDVVVELGVAPGARRHGVATALAREIRADPSVRPGHARVWAHGERPGSTALAASQGLHRDRELWMMRRPADTGPLPPPRAAEGITIGALRVGQDEPDVVAVNARAFAWHPEQGAMTVDDVRRREQEPWFDAAGFLLARDDASGRLLGFHWTKVHPDGARDGGPVGEVYVVGVDPEAQGRGLGGVLTLAGLHHLAGRGLDEVILYVEADNAPAVATYRRLGFEVDATDVSFGLPG